MSLKDFAEKYIDENCTLDNELEKEWEKSEKVEAISGIVEEYLKKGMEKEDAIKEIIKCV